jgi:hypothetical protein
LAGIEAGGHQVFTFAPSAQASRGVLQEEGFAGATTVAELLVNEKLQQAVRGQVIWIDEAGLLGTRILRQVFDLAGELEARVVLSGDTNQHGSVERAGALGLLERYAGIQPARVAQIQRQRFEYKDAVQAIAALMIGSRQRFTESLIVFAHTTETIGDSVPGRRKLIVKRLAANLLAAALMYGIIVI